MSRQTVVLAGGPCDGMQIATDRNPLLMPTNPLAATGEAPPTYPHFAEYRPSAFTDRDGRVLYRFVGLGVDEQPQRKALEA